MDTPKRRSRLARGQKLILGVMALALIGVLVVLWLLLREDLLPASVSPLALTPTARTPRATITPTPRITARVSPTPETVTPVPVTPTPAPLSPGEEILLARRIEALTQDVGQIRELPQQREIPLNFMSVSEMATYLRRTLDDAQRQEWVEQQQALLAALGLSPAPGEAFPLTVQTRANQVIAFYDPQEAQIFVVRTDRGPELGSGALTDADPAGQTDEPPDVSLVHQYAHALIDQHFSLSELAADPRNGDARRARDALAEGDALAVLMMQRYGGVEQIDHLPTLTELADHLSEAELTDYEGYLTSRAMHDLFVFPYREGALLVSALLRAGWWPAVNAAYLDPPLSTEQVLHPDKYVLAPRDEPRSVRLPDLGQDLGADWRLAGQDVLGELILRAHLDQYLPSTPQAEAAATGWDGDLAAVWQGPDGRQVLVLRTLWDGVGEAREFVGSYVTLVDNRLRGARTVSRPILPPGGRWWRGEGGNAYLEQTGDEVLIVWAPDTDTMERVLEAFVFEEE